MNYKKLDHVFNFIPKSIREAEGDDDQIRSWALQYLRTIESSKMKVYGFAILTIEDHKTCLPVGLKKISSIKLLSREPTANEVDSIKQCATQSIENVEQDCETGTCIAYSDYCMIAHQLWLNSPYKDLWADMQFVGTTNDSYFTSSCYNRIRKTCDGACPLGFSINTDGCLLTEAKDGFICIEYSAEPKDDNGNFLVPEKPIHIWQAISQYAIAQHWLNRTGYKEQNAFQMYQNHLQIARNYMREAKSIMRMSGMSYSNHYALTFGEVAILKIPSVFSFKTTDTMGNNLNLIY